jgi:hypothetical protein
MIKNFYKYIILSIVLIFIFILYLSYFGIKTSKFNSIIQNKIHDHNPRLDIKLNKVNFFLDLKKISIKIKAEKPVLIIDKFKEIEFEEITSNLSITSYLSEEFTIKNLKISTHDNDIKNILSFYRLINNSPKLMILSQFLKKGDVKFSIYLNFDQNGKINDDYEINGEFKNLQVSLLKFKDIKNINFKFNATNKNIDLKNIKFIYDKINFNSDNISIKDNIKNYFIKGSLFNNGDKVNKKLIQLFYKVNLEEINFNESTFNSKSNFSFYVNKKFKILDLTFNSEIKIDKFEYNLKNKNFKNFVTNYKDSIIFKKTKIKVEKQNKKWLLDGSSQYFLEDNLTNLIKFNIVENNGKLFFDSNIDLSPLRIEFKNLNYLKKEKISAKLFLQGVSKENHLFFKKIKFENFKNVINIKNLELQNNKIIKLDSANISFTNQNKFLNQISLNSKNQNFELIGKSFDAQPILNKISKDNNESDLFHLFENLNSNIFINIDELNLDQKNKVNNLNGNLKIKKNKIYTLDISSNFSKNEKLFLKIKTNKDNTVITNFYSDRAKPFVKKYKFIKGFEEGHIDFQSIKKNNLINSKLIIDNFKVQEVPILAKILTLASLQGIADLLTGEGIRFTDFEMLYFKKDNLITIEEIYCIGPAISIMMDGYIEKDNLISLRGTLVPATTINRTISSIPLLGDILVGKKVGEGIFGVSFKIKGPPKDLKTTVNPIKTLTPRFITRTLEKIKNN